MMASRMPGGADGKDMDVIDVCSTEEENEDSRNIPPLVIDLRSSSPLVRKKQNWGSSALAGAKALRMRSKFFHSATAQAINKQLSSSWLLSEDQGYVGEQLEPITYRTWDAARGALTRAEQRGEGIDDPSEEQVNEADSVLAKAEEDKRASSRAPTKRMRSSAPPRPPPLTPPAAAPSPLTQAQSLQIQSAHSPLSQPRPRPSLPTTATPSMPTANPMPTVPSASASSSAAPLDSSAHAGEHVTLLQARMAPGAPRKHPQQQEKFDALPADRDITLHKCIRAPPEMVGKKFRSCKGGCTQVKVQEGSYVRVCKKGIPPAYKQSYFMVEFFCPECAEQLKYLVWGIP